MVQSRATTVDAYLSELPAERREIVSRLRGLASRHLKGFTEGMEYGMPYYRGPNGTGVAFASQAKYIALYVGERAAERARKAGVDVGRSCVRFPNPATIDWTLVAELFRLSA